MKIYRIKFLSQNGLVTVLVICMFWFIGILSIGDVLEEVGRSGITFGTIFSGLWLLGVIWMTYWMLLKTTIQIKVLDDKRIEFRSLLKRITIPITDILSLKVGCLKVASRAQFSCPGFGPR